MKKAFTLIELLVVVLIIGILASIALSQYQKAVAKSRAMQLVVAAKTIADEQNAYFMANDVYASQADDLSSYPKNNATSLKVGKDTCTLVYSNQGSDQRVSCNMYHPYIVIQRHYRDGKLRCCAYPDDNYAGDKICQMIKNKSNWYNGCGENGCHCY